MEVASKQLDRGSNIVRLGCAGPAQRHLGAVGVFAVAVALFMLAVLPAQKALHDVGAPLALIEWDVLASQPDDEAGDGGFDRDRGCWCGSFHDVPVGR